MTPGGRSDPPAWDRPDRAPSTEDNNPPLRRAAALSALEGVATLALSSLANLLIARAAGPSGYAVFVAANLMVFVGTVAAGLGLPLALARRLGERAALGRRACAQTTSSALAVTASSAVVVGLLGAAAAASIERAMGLHISGWFTVCLPVVLLLAVASDTAQSAFYGLLRPQQALAISASGPAAMLLYLVARRLGDGAPFWGAVVVSYSVSGLVGLLLLARWRLLVARPSGAELGHLWRESPSAIAYTLFATFTGSADRWVAGTSLGATALGGYTSATLIVQSALRAPSYVGYLLVPATRRAAAGSTGPSDRVGSNVLRSYAIFAGACVVVLVVAPDVFLRTVFGDGFVFAANPLRLMAPSILAAGLSIPALAAITGSLESRRLPPLLLSVLAPRLLLLVVFSAWWGLAGVAAATTVGEVLIAVAAVAIDRPSAKPYRVVVGPYLVTGLAVAAGLALNADGVPHVVSAAVAVAFLAPHGVNLVKEIRT